MKKFKNMLGVLVLIIIFGLCMGIIKSGKKTTSGHNTTQLVNTDRTQANFWKTEKMKLLDSIEFNNQLVGMAESDQQARDEDSRAISKEIIEVLLPELQDERGVHVETALTAMGAVTGFAAQMGIREGLVKTGKVEEKKAFVVVGTKDGGTYYFGDLLNQNITEPKNGNDSILSIISARAQKLGAKKLPDTGEIYKRNAGALGSEKFSVPDVPAEHMPHFSAQALLWRYWNPIRAILILHTKDPLKWPLYLARTSADLMDMAKSSLDPAISSQLVMDAAIPMSKVDPRLVHQAYFKRY